MCPDDVVDRQLPHKCAAGFGIHYGGKAHFLATEPRQYLSCAPEFRQLGEDQFDRLLDAPIRIFLDLSIRGTAFALTPFIRDKSLMQ
jgi:hypothetical protein